MSVRMNERHGQMGLVRTVRLVEPVTWNRGTETRTPLCGPFWGAGISSPRRRAARLVPTEICSSIQNNRHARDANTHVEDVGQKHALGAEDTLWQASAVQRMRIQEQDTRRE
jgi:hypothetical protein